MRFALVDACRIDHPVRALCALLDVSPSGFYAWLGREPSARAVEDAELREAIGEVHAGSRGTYGSPRVHAELVAGGWTVGVNRVARLMREGGIRVRPARAFCRTTRSDAAHVPAPNELQRDFSAEGPNEKWGGDVTYVPTGEGWLYLATMIDLYNREVVGWAMGEHNDQMLTGRALAMALEAQSPPPGLIAHSDRGSTYTAGDYRDSLRDAGIVCSMSRRGDCWDNAVAESFFATIKKELVSRVRYATRSEAASSIFEWIEVFYNRVRRHSVLGYLTPVEYRQNTTATATSA